MKLKPRIRFSAGFLAVLLVVGFVGHPRSTFTALAQDDAPKAESSTDAAALKSLIERIDRLEAKSAPQKAVAPALKSPIRAMVDVSHLGLFYSRNSQSRFLALHVLLANPTQQAYSIKPDQVIAEIDGETRMLKELPGMLRSFSVPMGRHPVQVSSMKIPTDWKLPAEGQNGFWLVYSDLPLGANVPECRLKMKIGETTTEIDVNQNQKAQLDLDIQRIGPRQCLALITINGTMNTFNSGSFVDQLESLVEQNVARVVVRWGSMATPVDPQLMSWLQVAAATNGGNTNHNPLLPTIPASIREFHLIEFPSADDGQGKGLNRGGYGLRPTSQARLHKSATEAIGAALRTAYVALPKEELLNEIKTGHPLTRAAALAYGGGRLGVDHLPQLFEWAQDTDPELQKAALQALSNFGEPQAIDKLVEFARRNVEPLSSSAMESLAGSRFGSAHEALLALLKSEPDSSKKRIVQVIARYPRQIWSEPLFESIAHSPGGIDADSLKALIQIGHPELISILAKALNSPEKRIREQAFHQLVKRGDDQSESLAIEYALKRLETTPPDANTVQLLTRTKDSRAIPLLLKHLDSNHGRSNCINLLLQLGDSAVADSLVQKYPTLNNDEKAQILQGLRLYRHSRFHELCGEALKSHENQLVTTATNALRQEGSADGERLLILAIEEQKTPHLVANVMNALVDFGTLAARDALIRARDSDDENKRRYAREALDNLRHKSPGFHYCMQAYHLRRTNKESEAHEAYNIALKLDPTLPDAYLGRGQLLLKLEKFSAARKDFDKVIELKHEPKDASEQAEFVTGYAIARICDGQYVDGIKYLEDNRAKYVDTAADVDSKLVKGLYLYNSACAYSRAMEQIDKQPTNPDQQSLRDQYRVKAVSDLAESFKHGFDDYDWTSKDPDLKILHEDADFKKILAGKPADKPSENPAREDE